MSTPPAPRQPNDDPPTPRPDATRGGHRRGPGRWRVERIDTTPMTEEQHRAAVAALAVLITAWQQQQTTRGNGEPDSRKAA